MRLKPPPPPSLNRRCRIAGLLAAHPQAPITLATVSLAPITDSDLGLPEDHVAQMRAEEFVAAFASRRLRDDDQRRRQMPPACVAEKHAAPAAPPPIRRAPTVQPVRVEVPDDALVLVDPTDAAEDVEQAIVRELRRLTEKPEAGLH